MHRFFIALVVMGLHLGVACVASAAGAPHIHALDDPPNCNCHGTEPKAVVLANAPIRVGITFTGNCVGGSCEGTLQFSGTQSRSYAVPVGKCLTGEHVDITILNGPGPCDGLHPCPQASYTADSVTYTPIFSDCTGGNQGGG